MPKLPLLVSLTAQILLPIHAQAFDHRDMHVIASQLGVTVETGSGTVNGVNQKITGLLGAPDAQSLESVLYAYTKNRYTVTNEWSPYGRVFVIAKIYSSMCLSCPKPTAANVATILKDTYAITLLDHSTGLNAFGSKTGQIVNHGQSLPAYTESWLQRLAEQSEIVGFGEFNFASSRTRQLMGTFTGSRAEASALIDRSMMNTGYDRILATPEDTGILSHWRKGQSVTRIQLSEPNNGQIAWQAYEVSAP
jgi:hypothetical protein